MNGADKGDSDLLFATGNIKATGKAAKFMHENGINPGDLLTRHFTGDWSDMDAHDNIVNRAAIANGGRVFSEYKCPVSGSGGHQLVWIVTEADRSMTTILLPEEY